MTLIQRPTGTRSCTGCGCQSERDKIVVAERVTGHCRADAPQSPLELPESDISASQWIENMQL